MLVIVAAWKVNPWIAFGAALGMILGAALYAELYPFFKATVLSWRDYGKIGLVETLGVSPWVLVAGFWAICLPLFAWFEKKGL